MKRTDPFWAGVWFMLAAGAGVQSLARLVDGRDESVRALGAHWWPNWAFALHIVAMLGIALFWWSRRKL